MDYDLVIELGTSTWIATQIWTHKYVSIDDLKLEMAYAICWGTPKCSIIKVSTIVLGHVLYTYISEFGSWHLDWNKHVLHICDSCGRIEGGVGIERGEIKLRGGD